MHSIVVLGASVSFQSVHHVTGEMTGYSEALKHRSSPGFGIASLERRTYPGNRLSDGGLVRLPEVLRLRPDICLFEPLIEDRTRGHDARDEEILFVYASLVQAGILPVTLMLPVVEQRDPRANRLYARFRSICDRYRLPVVIVKLSDLTDVKGLFSASPHTNGAGAQVYSEQIVEQLAKLGNPADLLSQVQAMPELSSIAVRVKQLEKVSRGPRAGEMRLTLCADGDRPVTARLVQLQTIGPWSPVVELICTPAGGDPRRETLSIWDPYCHYARKSYVCLGKFTLEPGIPTDVALTITDQSPNYAACRRVVETWPSAAERRMMPLGHVFAISDGDLSEV